MDISVKQRREPAVCLFPRIFPVFPRDAETEVVSDRARSAISLVFFLPLSCTMHDAAVPLQYSNKEKRRREGKKNRERERESEYYTFGV